MTRVGEHTLGARAVKYNFHARAGKYKLGASAGGQEIQIPSRSKVMRPHTVLDKNDQIDLNKSSFRKTLNTKASFTPFIVQNFKTIFCKQAIVKQHIQACEAQ